MAQRFPSKQFWAMTEDPIEKSVTRFVTTIVVIIYSFDRFVKNIAFP